MINHQRRLYRSQSDKIIAGVCGGFAEYLNLDTTIIRLAWILLTLLGGSGLILYILAFFIVPEKPMAQTDSPPIVKSDFGSVRIFGILFVLVGAILLLDNLEILSFHRLWHRSWEFVFPGILILAGIYLLTKRGKTITNSSENPSATSEQAEENQIPPPLSSTEDTTHAKVFRRSLNDKKVFGICGGAGEYFDIDPTIIRIAYAIFTVLSSGVGIILYFLMYLIVPEGQPQMKKQE
jgi:phage shock protein C